MTERGFICLASTFDCDADLRVHRSFDRLPRSRRGHSRWIPCLRHWVHGDYFNAPKGSVPNCVACVTFQREELPK